MDRAATKGHIAYEVTDLAAFRRRLSEGGVEVVEWVPIPVPDSRTPSPWASTPGGSP